MERVLFKDSIRIKQGFQKLGAKRFGPFKIIRLVGPNALHLHFPSSFHIYPIVHTEHTSPYRLKPDDIYAYKEIFPPFVKDNGNLEFFVKKILSHHKRGRVSKFLTVIMGVPRHELPWEPSRDFIFEDLTIEEVCL